jgi:hypothetical protein
MMGLRDRRVKGTALNLIAVAFNALFFTLYALHFMIYRLFFSLCETNEIDQRADIVKCLPREDLLHLGCRPDPFPLNYPEHPGVGELWHYAKKTLAMALNSVKEALRKATNLAFVSMSNLIYRIERALPVDIMNPVYSEVLIRTALNYFDFKELWATSRDPEM